MLLDDISRMLTPAIFDDVLAVSADGKFEGVLVFEFVPHDKINGVSPDETPYCRRLPGNAVAMVQWDDPAPGPTKLALDLVESLATLLKVPGEAYGNYS